VGRRLSRVWTQLRMLRQMFGRDPIPAHSWTPRRRRSSRPVLAELNNEIEFRVLSVACLNAGVATFFIETEPPVKSMSLEQSVIHVIRLSTMSRRAGVFEWGQPEEGLDWTGITRNTKVLNSACS
jgi:hypothetical protein